MLCISSCSSLTVVVLLKRLVILVWDLFSPGMSASLHENLYWARAKAQATDRVPLRVLKKGKEVSPRHPQISVVPPVCCHSSNWLPLMRGLPLHSYKIALGGGGWKQEQGGWKGRAPHPAKLLAVLITILPLQLLMPHGLCFLSHSLYWRGNGLSSDLPKAALGWDEWHTLSLIRL